jgi:hypothetical protein
MTELTVLGVPLKTIFEVALAITTVAVGVLVGISRIKEWRAKKKGLASNPTRCLLHEGRLDKLEAQAKSNGEALARVETDIKNVDTVVNKILDLHLKK